MISPSNFIQGLFLGDFGASRHRNQTPGRGSRRSTGRARNKKWADLMATNGQFSWPSVGSSVAAYGQFHMAANTRAKGGSRVAAAPKGLRSHRCMKRGPRPASSCSVGRSRTQHSPVVATRPERRDRHMPTPTDTRRKQVPRPSYERLHTFGDELATANLGTPHEVLDGVGCRGGPVARLSASTELSPPNEPVATSSRAPTNTQQPLRPGSTTSSLNAFAAESEPRAPAECQPRC